ncbi:hypothetical protein ACOIYL_002232 [Vibrio parahaemolyticus]
MTDLSIDITETLPEKDATLFLDQVNGLIDRGLKESEEVVIEYIIHSVEKVSNKIEASFLHIIDKEKNSEFITTTDVFQKLTNEGKEWFSTNGKVVSKQAKDSYKPVMSYSVANGEILFLSNREKKDTSDLGVSEIKGLTMPDPGRCGVDVLAGATAGMFTGGPSGALVGFLAGFAMSGACWDLK